MTVLLTNLKIVLFSLLVLNFILLFVFRNPLRFIKGPLVLFSILAITCLTYRVVLYPATNQQIREEKEAEIQKKGWEYINDPEVDAAFIKREQANTLVNRALFRITGLQTVFAFVLAAIGVFIAPDKKLFGLYALGFLVLAFLFLT